MGGPSGLQARDGDTQLVFHDHAPPALTTVMMRNIPYSYTRSRLLELLDAHGFSDQYDFVYMPVDFETTRSLGFAFVNLSTTQQALHFMSFFFDGFTGWAVHRCKKVCEVCWGETQGLRANIQRFR